MDSVVRFATKLTRGVCSQKFLFNRRKGSGSDILSYQVIYEIDTGVDVPPKEVRAANPSRSPVKHARKRRSAVHCPVLTVLDVLN
jgi:hypothetical protein